MALFLLLFSSVTSLECNKPCTDFCSSLDSSTECLNKCCPSLSLSLSSSCSLICDESQGIYICEQKCAYQSTSCDANCQEFCDTRSDDCLQACIYEFCGEESHPTNWVFVIALIFLFSGFIITLYLQLENILNKPSDPVSLL